MLPDSNNTAPTFIQDQPDWGKPVLLTISWNTVVTSSKNRTEQRTQKRSKAKLALQFSLTPLNTAEMLLRRARFYREMAKPIVCPVWPDYYAATFSGNNATVDTEATDSNLKVGSYAYITSSLGNYFRRITAISSTTLTFHATDYYPHSIPAPTEGRVYPCITGIHASNQAEWTATRLEVNDLTLSIAEL
jgi:hypothetical protein